MTRLGRRNTNTVLCAGNRYYYYHYCYLRAASQRCKPVCIGIGTYDRYTILSDVPRLFRYDLATGKVRPGRQTTLDIICVGPKKQATRTIIRSPGIWAAENNHGLCDLVVHLLVWNDRAMRVAHWALSRTSLVDEKPSAAASGMNVAQHQQSGCTSSYKSGHTCAKNVRPLCQPLHVLSPLTRS